MNGSGVDYNRRMKPMMQRLLMTVCLVSGIVVSIGVVICIGIATGVIPQQWFQ